MNNQALTVVRPQSIITGDLVDDDKNLQKCLNWIPELKCKHDKYFAPGNWEHWSGTLQNDLISKLNAKGVKTLYNSGEIIDVEGGNFFLAGIDDAYFGAPNSQEAFRNQRTGIPTIVLSHSPVGVNILKSFRTDLILSGHTHGGQVRLPGIGALQTPPGSGKFEMGLYRVGKDQLYVNRGIGTSIIPFRFMCPPELTLIEITGT